MSTFQTETIKCPACAAPVECVLALRIDGDRLPALREAILDGSLQRQACAHCGIAFRVEPAFVLVDADRGQYLGVWPLGVRPEWRDYAQRTRAAFDAASGEAAPGLPLEPRVVFGWAALVEKMLARQAGIDDRTLELAKVATLRHGYQQFVPGPRELRLVGLGEGDVVLAWVDGASGAISDGVRVPRALFAEIEAEPETWRSLREDVAEGLVVDFQRARWTV